MNCKPISPGMSALGASGCSTTLDEMVAVSARHGGTHLETTVTPGNVPSRTMFAALAERHSAQSLESELMVSGHFPDAHEPERLIRMGPFR